MALVLDDRCRAAVARRRSRGKDTRVFVRFERGSVRAGIPWVVATGWVQQRRLPEDLEVQRICDADVYLEGRIARYCRRHDLVVSAARLGPFEWLLMADQYAADLIRVWERSSSTAACDEGPAPAPETSDREPIALPLRREYRVYGRGAR